MTEPDNVTSAPDPGASIPQTPLLPRVALQRWRSHKEVEAARICSVEPSPVTGEVGLTLAVEADGEATPRLQWVTEAWVRKHAAMDSPVVEPADVSAKALVGGYFVRYADGYESWSPAAAFEQGYTPASVEPASQETVHRTIRTHHVNAANKQLQIDVLDLPGSGAACHLYRISGFDTASNPSDPFVRRHGQSAKIAMVLFQNGPIGEVGVNGITHEALLAILRDRLEAFQEGPYRCDENAGALAHIVRAIHYLNLRTQQREARGVEGTHQV